MYTVQIVKKFIIKRLVGSIRSLRFMYVTYYTVWNENKNFHIFLIAFYFLSYSIYLYYVYNYSICLSILFGYLYINMSRKPVILWFHNSSQKFSKVKKITYLMQLLYKDGLFLPIRFLSNYPMHSRDE